MGCEEVFAAEDDCAGAIAEGAGVWGGDGPVFGRVGDEGGFHAAEFVLVEWHGGFFVGFHFGGGFASRAGDRDGAYLPVEAALLLCSLCALDRTDRVLVLGLSPESMVGCTFFRGHTHQFTVVGVHEAIFGYAVEEFDVAVFLARAELGEVVWGVGHGFCAAGHNAGGVAEEDGLGGEDDGFEARGADFVDGGADGGVGEGGAAGALAGGVLAETVERREEGLVGLGFLKGEV